MRGTQAALAKHLGVARSTVSKAVRDGVMTADPDGKFDFARCTEQWQAHGGARPDVAARHAAQRAQTLPTTPATPQSPPTDAPKAAVAPEINLPLDDGARRNAKTLLLHYENSQIKLEMALRRGLRYELAAVKREAFAMGAMLRAAVERVIDQTAPRLAACTTVAERRAILETEIRRLKSTTKREMPRALRRMREFGKPS